MKNAYLFYVVFQVSKVFLIKSYKKKRPVLLLLVLLEIDSKYIIFYNFLELCLALTGKFVTIFPFLTEDSPKTMKTKKN